MEIISVGFSPLSNKTVVSVQLAQVLTASVKQMSPLYSITLSGHFSYESPDLHDRVADCLIEAGIPVLPVME